MKMIKNVDKYVQELIYNQVLKELGIEKFKF